MKNSGDLKEWIERQLAEREPGYRLPVARELAGQFGLAQITVNRTLRPYVTAGRLVRIPGKGTFLPGNPEQTVTEPVSAQNAAHELADTIRASIARGEYKKGDALPQLTYMSLRFKLSYKTVIDAYRLLVASEQVVRVGKTFRVGTFRDNTAPTSGRDIYIFLHNSDDFGGLFRSYLRFSYRKMENELNTAGFRINYANTGQMETLFTGWRKDRDIPHALMLANLQAHDKDAPIEHLRRCLARIPEEMPRVLLDSMSLRIPRNVIQAPHVLLTQGHATTASVRALSDYMAEKKYRQAVIFMDETVESWVVGGNYFAPFRLAWEAYDRKSEIELQYVIRPAGKRKAGLQALREKAVPHRIRNNARRTLNPAEEQFAEELEARTRIALTYTSLYSELYEPGVLWVFSSDAQAAHALEWAEKKKIRVPEELSVIGLEHKPEYFHLGLSYCGPDWDTIGYQMAHALIGDMPVAKTGRGFLRTRADMFAKRTSR